MQTQQTVWRASEGWAPVAPAALGPAHLVFVFGGRPALETPGLLEAVREGCGGADLVGCSTAGEIDDHSVSDDSVVVTAITFDRAWVRCAAVDVAAHPGSEDAGRLLADRLDPTGLVHVFVLSEGLRVNGSDLVKGLTSRLPPHVTITGGLSADGPRFERTLVVWNQVREHTVLAVGLYGPSLRIGFGSLGGWDDFGPERIITRSAGNVLYELDGQSSLALYKRYLGEHAKNLPASGLLFPLSIRTSAQETGVVRTILAVDEAHQSLTFAGDVPEGARARLMKANFDRLIEGAAGAARTSHRAIAEGPPQLALLISCVGRKMVLQQRVEEELEAAREVFGPDTRLTGFYSYGEISPRMPAAACELHNQTMTITTLFEHSG